MLITGTAALMLRFFGPRGVASVVRCLPEVSAAHRRNRPSWPSPTTGPGRPRVNLGYALVYPVAMILEGADRTVAGADRLTALPKWAHHAEELSNLPTLRLN